MYLNITTRQKFLRNFATSASIFFIYLIRRISFLDFQRKIETGCTLPFKIDNLQMKRIDHLPNYYLYFF